MSEIALKRPPVALHPKPQNRKPRPGAKSGGQGGTLTVAAAGAVFLAYVFDFDGFEGSVDGYFHSLDAAARAQTPAVAHLYLAVLPYAGMALALGFLWIMMRTVLGMISGAVTPKKKAAQAPMEQPQPELGVAHPSNPAVNVASAAQPSHKPAAVCVKPIRLSMRDVGVAKVILPRR